MSGGWQLFALLMVSSVACRPQSADIAPTDCVGAGSVGSDWRVLQSYETGMEMRHPAPYVLKDWSNVSNPELGKTVELWLDDSPANSVAFAKTSDNNSRFSVKEEGPIYTCSVSLATGTWKVRTFTQYTSQDGKTRRALFVVAARMVLSGDSLPIRFVGVSRNIVEQGTQITMLRSFRRLAP